LAPTCQISRSGRDKATSVWMRSAAVAAISPDTGRLTMTTSIPVKARSSRPSSAAE
jgi:hypothetical protein